MNDLARETLHRLVDLPADALRALFHRLDHEGRAEPIGDEHDTVEQALAAEGFAVIDARADDEGALCIAHRGASLVIACDAFGPWAARVHLDDLAPTPDLDPLSPDLPLLDARPLTVRLAELAR